MSDIAKKALCYCSTSFAITWRACYNTNIIVVYDYDPRIMNKFDNIIDIVEK